jgi:hypothetical protein
MNIARHRDATFNESDVGDAGFGVTKKKERFASLQCAEKTCGAKFKL